MDPWCSPSVHIRAVPARLQLLTSFPRAERVRYQVSRVRAGDGVLLPWFAWNLNFGRGVRWFKAQGEFLVSMGGRRTPRRGRAMSEEGPECTALGQSWRQDSPIFPQAARDWQAGLVSHGFREGELEKGRDERRSQNTWNSLGGGTIYANDTVTSQRNHATHSHRQNGEKLKAATHKYRKHLKMYNMARHLHF